MPKALRQRGKPPLPGKNRHHDILQHGEIRQDRGDLETSAQSHARPGRGIHRGHVTPEKPDRPGIGFQRARDLRDQCGLPGTVRADQGMDFAGTQVERNGPRGLECAENLGQAGA